MTNYPFDYDVYDALEPFEEPEPPRQQQPVSRRGGKRLAPKEPSRQTERRRRPQADSRRPQGTRSHSSQGYPRQEENPSRYSEEERPRRRKPRRRKRLLGRILLILFCILIGAGLGMLAFLWESGMLSLNSLSSALPGAPSGTPVNQTCLTVDTLEPTDFVTDLSEDTQVSFASPPDFTTPGTREVSLVLSGGWGRETTLTATLTVEADTTPPVIEGVSDRTIFLGEKVAYKQGITVTDDYDQEVALEVDSSQVDPTRAGSYTVTYRATDRSGNTAEATALFSFTQPSEYAELAAEKAKDVLSQITAGIEVTSGSDTDYKIAVARAIYDWCRNTIGYSGHSEKGDWQQAAYEGFTKRSGDCYTYFSTAKALLEAAEIPNIDVEKTYVEGRAMHYWSLINCGTGWYHFDTTPRVGDGDDFFMVTDAFLEAYSVSHKNSHEFDHSLYPATPAE